jgi:hypothetical protein
MEETIMPRRVLPLTDVQIRNAKPRDKPYSLTDGHGLYIEIMPTGSKLWRMKFRARALATIVFRLVRIPWSACWRRVKSAS